jgi:hypothetical protein
MEVALELGAKNSFKNRILVKGQLEARLFVSCAKILDLTELSLHSWQELAMVHEKTNTSISPNK